MIAVSQSVAGKLAVAGCEPEYAVGATLVFHTHSIRNEMESYK